MSGYAFHPDAFADLDAFNPAQGKKDEGHVSRERTVVTVELPPDAGEGGTLKIVGRWHDVSRLRFANPVQSIGPFIGTVDPDGQMRPAVTLAILDELRQRR